MSCFTGKNGTQAQKVKGYVTILPESLKIQEKTMGPSKSYVSYTSFLLGRKDLPNPQFLPDVHN